MNDMSKQLHFNEPASADPDPGETAEWREALLSLASSQGPARARQILDEMRQRSADIDQQRFNAQYRSLGELLQQADFICLTLPLTAATERLIGTEEFALMRPQSIFINISRGKVVDEAALIEALRTGQIRAAGLDVFEREPLDLDSPLLQMDNVVATPHMGSATHETREAMARCAVENLLAALAGERPANLVNVRAWKA